MTGQNCRSANAIASTYLRPTTPTSNPDEDDLDSDKKRKLKQKVDSPENERRKTNKKNVLSIIALLGLVAAVIPFQVAFLVLFVVQLWTWAGGDSVAENGDGGDRTPVSAESSPRLPPVRTGSGGAVRPEKVSRTPVFPYLPPNFAEIHTTTR